MESEGNCPVILHISKFYCFQKHALAYTYLIIKIPKLCVMNIFTLFCVYKNVLLWQVKEMHCRLKKIKTKLESVWTAGNIYFYLKLIILYTYFIII